MYIADLHIHSRYSRATSRDCTPEFLDLWARRKGIDIVGTGDFTHPAWREELSEKLIPDGSGLYLLKDEYRISDATASGRQPRFVISGEISSIYKKYGKVRKVHSLILLPGLEAAKTLSQRLETIGNIHSDGRPILGLDCRDLLEITLEACPEAVYVPAHIWTPHFSLFGAFSGFDSIEECYGDLAPHIRALETGLSSDPPMNWRVSALDSCHLISNSDAHSPAKLGREANLLDIRLTYQDLSAAILEGRGLDGTIEFFPEEGKYHYDGHRKCHLCLTPSEANQYQGRCPVCGRKLTIGVLHRVEQMADRGEGYVLPGAKAFESLVPLPEVIAASTGRTPASAKVTKQYEQMLRSLGSEFSILREIPAEDIRKSAGPLIAEGISRLRAGRVERLPGYDGEYGTIRLLENSEISALEGQLSLFSSEELQDIARGETAAARIQGGFLQNPDYKDFPQEPAPKTPGAEAPQPSPAVSLPLHLNPEQAAAAHTPSRAIAVIAGPGTGKTGTLIARLLYLLGDRRVKPAEITAVTFTNKAAAEIKDRLEQQLGGKSLLRQMNTGTFHSICSRFLRDQGIRFTLADEFDILETAGDTIRKFDLGLSPRQFLSELSRVKTGLSQGSEKLPAEAAAHYQASLRDMEALDFDDLLLETLRLLENEDKNQLRKNHFSYLLVDEFQDVNPLQYRLIQAWNRDGRELFVIGDPDQSIYGFRGADPGCFRRLSEDFPGLVTLRLRQNYRSTPEILAEALPVISRNRGPARQMEPIRESGAKVRLITAPGELSEGIFVAKEINRLIGGIDMLGADGESNQYCSEKPRSFSDIALLYRTHRQADLLETCLQKEGIPYVVAGSDDFLSDQTVRGAVCFFRFLLDPGDLLSKRLCERLLWRDSADAVKELTELSDLLRPKARRAKPEKLLELFAEHLALKEDASLQKLSAMSVFYKTMADFLQSLTFGVEGELKRSHGKSYGSDCVTLMTLHGSKGLEFPVVFLCGMRKGVFPLELAGRTQDLEEERRLFYVGMTRAREELFLTTSPEPSPFLEELPNSRLVCETTGKKNGLSGVRQLSLFDFI